MSVVNTCLGSAYTLYHRSRNTRRRGVGVEIPINNQIKVKSQMVHVNPEITSFESMTLVITIHSITFRLSVINRMSPVKSRNSFKQSAFCYEFNYCLEILSSMVMYVMIVNIVIVGDFNIDWLN